MVWSLGFGVEALRAMNSGFMKRLTVYRAVFSESVEVHAYSIRTPPFVIIHRRQTVNVTPSRLIPLSANIPRILILPRGSPTMPTTVGGNTNGLSVVNAGDGRGNPRIVEGSVGMEDVSSELKQTNGECSVCHAAIPAYKQVLNRNAMEGAYKTVDMLEALSEKDGKEKGTCTSVSSFERSAEKVDDVGKSEGNVEEDAVGKTEKMDALSGNFEGKVVSKTEATTGKTIGKAENDNVGKLETGKVVGKAEGDVGKATGKSVGKAEGGVGKATGKAVGKAEGGVGKATGKDVGKAEGDVGNVTGKAVGKAGEGEIEKASHKFDEKDEGSSVGKASEKSPGYEVVKAGKNIQNQTMGKASSTDDNFKEYVIAVAGKSDMELSYAENLTGTAGCLKLPEGTSLVAYEKVESNEDGFQVDVFLDQLMTRHFGKLLFYARQLPSTHTLLSQNFKTLPVGTVSVADVQFQGKGRAGNSWESPKGCLMFSFTVQMSDGRAVPFLQYVVSLAVIEGIESLCLSKGFNAPEVRIKWPNDLYAKGLKVGGVLCTSTYSSKKFNIVVGVGLNVGNKQPTTCLDALLEEINKEAPSLPRDELLAAIISKFEDLFDLFLSKGFYALESEYYRRWLHSGQTVVLEERAEGSHEVSHVPLKIQGLTPAGYLRAVDDASETYELHPDGNSFDFLKGLVRKKI